MKKMLFGLTSLFLVGIVILIGLLFITEVNPFNLTYWVVIFLSGFFLSLSSYIVCEKIKYDKQLIFGAFITFSFIIGIITLPKILYDLFWNHALTLIIIIISIALASLIPKSRTIINICAKVSLLISTGMLTIMCFLKVELTQLYSITFYALAFSTILHLFALIISKSTKTV